MTDNVNDLLTGLGIETEEGTKTTEPSGRTGITLHNAEWTNKDGAKDATTGDYELACKVLGTNLVPKNCSAGLMRLIKALAQGKVKLVRAQAPPAAPKQ